MNNVEPTVYIVRCFLMDMCIHGDVYRVKKAVAIGGEDCVVSVGLLYCRRWLYIFGIGLVGLSSSSDS